MYVLCIWKNPLKWVNEVVELKQFECKLKKKKNEGRFKLKEMFADITQFNVGCFNNGIYHAIIPVYFLFLFSIQFTFVLYAAASMTYKINVRLTVGKVKRLNPLGLLYFIGLNGSR